MNTADKINAFFANPANRRSVLLGIGGYCLVAVTFSGLQRLGERASAPTPTPAPAVAVAPAPAPVATPAPAPQPKVRSYDPVGQAMLQAARNNYHRCKRENGSDVLGYAACEDARQTYEYARSQYAN